MKLIDKVALIDELNDLQKVQDFEAQLEKNPLGEDQLSMLTSKTRATNMEYLSQLRGNGQIVQPTLPPIREYAVASEGYVVRQSTLDQMPKDVYTQVRRSGLLNKGVDVYHDVDPSQEIIVHYEYIFKNRVGQKETRYTYEGKDMVRAKVEKLNYEEAQAIPTKIRESARMYKESKSEWESLLQNLDSITSGQFNTQYFN